MQVKIAFSLLAALAFAALANFAFAAEGDAAAQKTTVVTVEGKGTTYDEAKMDAMRNAIEQGAGVEIASHTETKDFELVRDEIISRANGYISAFKELSKKEEGGIFTVKIEATVNVGKVTEDWATIALLIKQKGHPKMLVVIVDKIDNNTEESEQANSEVIDYFLQKGFLLVDKDQIKEVDAKDLKVASIKNDVSKLVALAANYKAQIVIAGYASANFSRSTEMAGRPFHFYNADCTIKVFRTDDAKLLFQKNWSLPQDKLAQDASKEAAAKKGLKAIAKKLAPEAAKAITTAWIKELYTGNEITVVISNCPYKFRREVQAKLKELKDITSVSETSYTEKTLELTVVTTMSASNLLDKLVDKQIITEEAAENSNVSGNKLSIQLPAKE
jgi:hypothetical protein